MGYRLLSTPLFISFNSPPIQVTFSGLVDFPLPTRRVQLYLRQIQPSPTVRPSPGALVPSLTHPRPYHPRPTSLVAAPIPALWCPSPVQALLLPLQVHPPL